MLSIPNFETVPLSILTQQGVLPSEDRHRPLVMVVNDERIIADTRAAILTGWGYAVLTAYDAESALELAALIPPELLLCDVMLTRSNGLDFAIAMRRIVPDCKVVLFSGRIDDQALLDLPRYADHAFTLLAKPLHPAQLWLRLAEMQFESQNHFAKSEPN